MEKEIKIQVPEGYEIDKEKSSFEKIVFKKKKAINCWEDLEKISGYGITTENDIVHWPELTTIEENKNVFIISPLARISQLNKNTITIINLKKVTTNLSFFNFLINKLCSISNIDI